MMTALAALWPWLLALGVICAGLWWARGPIDSPTLDRDAFLVAVLWDTRDLSEYKAQIDEAVAQAIHIANEPAFERTLAEIRMLPEVAS